MTVRGSVACILHLLNKEIGGRVCPQSRPKSLSSVSPIIDVATDPNAVVLKLFIVHHLLHSSISIANYTHSSQTILSLLINMRLPGPSFLTCFPRLSPPPGMPQLPWNPRGYPVPGGYPQMRLMGPTPLLQLGQGVYPYTQVSYPLLYWKFPPSNLL